MTHSQQTNRLERFPAQGLIDLFRHTFNTLAVQSDLSPSNPVVNEMLTYYVNAVIEADQEIADRNQVLKDPGVLAMMQMALSILSRAEFEMEKHFAEIFEATGPMPLSGLNRFWYRANYKALVKLEMDGIKQFTPQTMADQRPIAFIGSGPLPLSAIDYYLLTGKSCTCIELDESAAKQSMQLIKNIGLDDVITVKSSDGCHVDYKDYSMIFVAALVQNKVEVLDRIQATANDAIIGIRSADGLKQLLYKQVSVPDIEAHGFSHVGTTLGNDNAVNSTCFFKAKGVKSPGL